MESCRLYGDHPHVVRYLLEKFKEQIDVMAFNFKGFSAFHLAAETCDVDVMKLLLAIDRSGLNDRSFNYGLTPLHLAARRARIDIVEFLLTEGCDVNACDTDFEFADDYARSEDIKAMLQEHRNK